MRTRRRRKPYTEIAGGCWRVEALQEWLSAKRIFNDIYSRVLQIPAVLTGSNPVGRLPYLFITNKSSITKAHGGFPEFQHEDSKGAV
jgi:hypothetical protein